MSSIPMTPSRFEEKIMLEQCALRLKMKAVDKLLSQVVSSGQCEPDVLDMLVSARGKVKQCSERLDPVLALTPPASPPERPRALRATSAKELESVFYLWENYVPQLDDCIVAVPSER